MASGPLFFIKESTLKIALCSAVWDRLPLSRVWWKGLSRVRSLFRDAGIDSQIFVGGSQQEHLDLCQQYEACWVPAVNNPLGAKWNAVAKQALQEEADYIFLLGMDDFFSSPLAEQYLPLMERKVPFVALRGIFMYEPASGRVLRIMGDEKGNFPAPPGAAVVKSRKPQSRFGAGRLIHRSLFAGHSYFWEPERNRWLDGSMRRLLKLPPPVFVVPTAEHPALDVKTPDNLWSFDDIVKQHHNCELPDASFLSVLPEWPEIKALAQP